MKKSFCICLIIVILSVMGCCSSATDEDTFMHDFLREKGYEIISYEGEADNYIFTKEMLKDEWYFRKWVLQEVHANITPDQYFDEKIGVHAFIVKNHSLENTYNENRTKVRLIVVQDKIIGGLSMPDSDSDIVYAGGPHFLDGDIRSWEDITGMSYIEWFEKYKEKYDI